MLADKEGWDIAIMLRRFHCEAEEQAMSNYVDEDRFLEKILPT